MNAFYLALLAFFESLGLMVPNIGWIMYFFAMPVCYAFVEIDSPWIGYPLLALHLIAFPIVKRSARFQGIDPDRRLDDQVADFAWDMLTPRIFRFRSAQANRDIVKSAVDAVIPEKPPDEDAPP